MKQTYAWEYDEPRQDGSILVRFLDWPKGYSLALPVGEKITVTQSRFYHCEGDNSETIENIGNGQLKLVRRMGEGCGSQTHILHAN